MMNMDLVQDRGDVAPWEHEKSSTFSAGQRTVLSFRRTPQLLAHSSPITCCREHLCCCLYRCPRLGFEEAAEKALVCVSLFEGMRITREGKISNIMGLPLLAVLLTDLFRLLDNDICKVFSQYICSSRIYSYNFMTQYTVAIICIISALFVALWLLRGLVILASHCFVLTSV